MCICLFFLEKFSENIFMYSFGICKIILNYVSGKSGFFPKKKFYLLLNIKKLRVLSPEFSLLFVF